MTRMQEFAFIDWIRSQTAADPDRVPVGPGDDCAVVRLGDQLLLVTVDQCADGVHFVVSDCGYEAAGYKVMARSLSDIAAMAGEPLGAVATVALPRGMAEDDARELYNGMRRAGDAFNCPLVGGDISAWDHPLHTTVTMWGRPIGKDPVLRSGAKVGDWIFVTGRLGGAVRSGRHLAFTPRIAEARELTTLCNLHALIDLSDGLASDLRHICGESGVGAEILADAVPVSPEAMEADDPFLAALTEGEDYELLFTLSPEDGDKLLRQWRMKVPITLIGRIRSGAAIELTSPEGEKVPLEQFGFRHEA